MGTKNYIVDSNKVDEDLENFPAAITLDSDDFTDLGITDFSPDDDFTGNDGDSADVRRWETFSSPMSIQSNRLYGETGIGASSDLRGEESRYYFSGDFDVQVDWEQLGTSVGTERFENMLSIENDDRTNLYRIVKRYRDGAEGITAWRLQGSWSRLGTYNTTADIGKFRITRVGSTITMYYDIGGGWVQLGTAGSANTGQLKVLLILASADSRPYNEFTFDNFKVNSGTIVWPGDAWKNLTIESITSGFSPDDDFTGTDGSSPDINKWDITAGNPIIQDNKLEMNVDSSEVLRHIKSTYNIRGDFDTQVDFENITYPATSQWVIYLRITEAANSDNYSEVRYDSTDNTRKYRVKTDNTTITSLIRTDASGKFRASRSGSIINMYYWNNGWVYLGNDNGNIGTADVKVNLISITTSPYPTYEGYMDNFVVNSADEIIYADPVDCYIEVDQWDETNNTAVLWTRIPELSSRRDTTLKITWDDTDNTSYIGTIGQTPAETVWDSNYIAVYHMSQTPSNNILDSTSNNRNGTPVNMESGDSIDGGLGKALDFDGSNEYITLGTSSAFKPANVSISTYINPDNAVKNFSGIVSNTHAGGYAVKLQDNRLFTIWHDGSTYRSKGTNAVISNGNWYAYGSSYDGQYADTSLDDTDYSQSVFGSDIDINYSTSNATIIGAEAGSSTTPDSGYYYNGRISEMHLSNIKRSSAWLAATNATFSGTLLSEPDITIEVQTDVQIVDIIQYGPSVEIDTEVQTDVQIVDIIQYSPSVDIISNVDVNINMLELLIYSYPVTVETESEIECRGEYVKGIYISHGTEREVKGMYISHGTEREVKGIGISHGTERKVKGIGIKNKECPRE